jgi:hypothetical protein
VPDGLPHVGHEQKSASDKFLFLLIHHTFASDSRPSDHTFAIADVGACSQKRRHAASNRDDWCGRPVVVHVPLRMNGKIVVPEAADSAQGWSDAHD